MIQETYTELTNDYKEIIITWILSHEGIEGNEKAKEKATNKRITTSQSYQDLLASKLKEKNGTEFGLRTNRTKMHDITFLPRKYQTTI